jgi:hypothetical protein
MEAKKIIKVIFLFLFIAVFSSCSDKFDLSTVQTDNSNVNISGDTLFVQLYPVWEGFNKPQDVMVGREPFIYVADTDNDRIVMLNLDGQVLGSRSIKRPVALAQDHRLNLLVCAKFDTIINANPQTFSAVFKFDMTASNHQLATAPEKRILPQLSNLSNTTREYTGVAVFYNNTYLVTRRGPNNSNPIDPDNSILIFNQVRLEDGTTQDIFAGSIGLLDPLGTGIYSANSISSISAFNLVNFDIVITLTGENSFKTQWLKYVVTPDFTGYLIALPPQESDIMSPQFFDKPEGTAIDNSGNIYVADAGKDSVYKFNPFGDLLIAFGGTDHFSNPHAVAFFDRTLYVADTENNRILRFILSTDLK